MVVDRLSDIEYAQFKEYAYDVYLYSLEHPEKDVINDQMIAVHNYFNSELLDKIFETTMVFPYDTELFSYLSNKKLNSENLELAEEEFGITQELLLSKIKEYVDYNFSTVLDKGLIKQDYIYKLSRRYIEEKNKKNNKSVDF